MRSRFARAALGALLLLAAYGVWLTQQRPLLPPPGGPNAGADLRLYEAVVDRVRAGEPYYAVAGSELPARGYPTASIFNWRLPTLAVLSAALPPGGARALLGGLSLLALAVWFAGLRRYGREIAVAGPALLLGVLAWPVLPTPHLVHETWAGVLIALSLGCTLHGLTAGSVAAGLGALAFREHAALYVLAMLVLAAHERRRAEAAVWAAGLAAFGIALALHALAVAGRATGAGVAAGHWLALGGWGYVVQTAHVNLWLLALPPAITAVVAPLSLAGLLGWRDAAGRRVTAAVCAFIAAFLFVGRPNNHLWGILYSGPLLLGLAFAPRSLRSLWAAARAGAGARTVAAADATRGAQGPRPT